MKTIKKSEPINNFWIIVLKAAGTFIMLILILEVILWQFKVDFSIFAAANPAKIGWFRFAIGHLLGGVIYGVFIGLAVKTKYKGKKK